MLHPVIAGDQYLSAKSLEVLPSNGQNTPSSTYSRRENTRRATVHPIVQQRSMSASDEVSILPISETSSARKSLTPSNVVRMEQYAPSGEEIKTVGGITEVDGDSYYSLKRILEQRRGNRDEDSVLSRRVKRFYKDQDELIDVYEQVELRNVDADEMDKYEKERLATKRITNILTKVSLGVNIVLFVLKIAAAVISKSLSVISSVIDSAVDLTTSVILFWAWRAIKKRDTYLYPQGRTRLEPVAIVILSVIMCAASVLIIYDSITTIADDAKYFTEKNTTRTLSEIDMSAFPISTMVITAVSKAILFFLCFRIPNPTMSALAEDHRNDVFSNIVALACGLVGSYAYRNKISQKAIVVDPIGAILISLYIICAWIKQANQQVKRLSGYTADPKFLSQITWITYHHSQLITKIDTVRAFHFGTAYLVEVDIVLPETMLLKEAHDIGEELQKKLEKLPEVERAFVHLDYEFEHKPSDEHKIV